MPNVRPHGHMMGALVEGQLPDPEPTDEIALMIDDAQQSPAWGHIADAFFFLARAGLDRTDPSIVRRVIAHGERMYAWAEAQPEIESSRVHEPVVYYFKLGDLVKIGTSTNVGHRMETLNPQTVLAIERGGHKQERQRHALFGALRVHGEWFRHEDPLAAYIVAVADAFEGDFGETLETWLSTHGASTRV